MSERPVVERIAQVEGALRLSFNKPMADELRACIAIIEDVVGREREQANIEADADPEIAEFMRGQAARLAKEPTQ